MIRPVAPLTLLAVLALAAPAGAATVQRDDVSDIVDDEEVVVAHQAVVTASRGEANRITVRAEGTEVVVHDDGAPLSAKGAGCTAVDAHSVRCTGVGPVSAADRTPGDILAAVDAGDGDDVVTSTGAGAVVLDGGTGADTVTGGAGDDVLVLTPRDAAGSLDGGAGHDALRLPDAPATVVDLARGTAAAQRVAGVEVVDDGDAASHLAGTNDADVFSAGNGADTILARGGDDRVGLGITADVAGGVESVFVQVPDEEADHVDCGAGTDTVDHPGANDVLRDCEWVEGVSLVQRRPVLRTARTLQVRVIVRDTTRLLLRTTVGRQHPVLARRTLQRRGTYVVTLHGRGLDRHLALQMLGPDQGMGADEAAFTVPRS